MAPLKAPTAAQRIRKQVDAASQKRVNAKVTVAENNVNVVVKEDTPQELTRLRPLAPPVQRAAPPFPLGAFSFFPIGDLALIAPVELPVGGKAFPQASPAATSTLRTLTPPAVSNSRPQAKALGVIPEFDRQGVPPQLGSYLIAISAPAFRSNASEPFPRPARADVRTTIARQSQVETLSRTTAARYPGIEHLSFDVILATGQLKLNILSPEGLKPRQAGARIAKSAPPRPLPATTTFPQIPDRDMTLARPGWRRGVLIPVPGLVPAARPGRPILKDLAPWLVPARPKPPALDLSIQATPEGWQHLRQGFVANPQNVKFPFDFQPPTEPKMDLSTLATALDEPMVQGIDRRPASERPWPAKRHIPVITPFTDWWMTCSNQVKVMVIALPLLCAIAIQPLTRSSGIPSMEERPSAPVRAAHAANGRPGLIPSVSPEVEATVEKATRSKFDGFKRAIVTRAAVAMADDFQAGLDSWEGNRQLGPSWSYDRTGFIRPRALGIYTPSMPLSDYAFEFLAKMDQHAISWAFRASDLNNYYAMKLVDKTGGVTPQMALVHYAVIEGREGPKKEVPLPISVYKDTLFRIRMDIQGPHFSVQVQGTVVDYWKDPRLKAGGVGFFASRGEESRVRWVQVTHQDDMLGKFCAFLAPYAM